LEGRGRWISEFEASQPGLQSEFQDSQGYTEKTCLEKPTPPPKKIVYKGVLLVDLHY
jgi:hypothetical protein